MTNNNPKGLSGFLCEVTDYKVTGKAPFARKILICPHCGEPGRKITERR